MSMVRSDAARDIAFLLGLVFIIILIIWIHESSPYLTIGTLSTTKTRILTAGVTITATIFTSLVGSQIQNGLIRSIEDRLQSIQDEPHMIQDPTSAGDDHHQVFMRELEQVWRSILKIDSVLERVKNYPVFLLYLFCGLITTSIVTTFTPTLATKSVPYSSIIPDTSFGLYSTNTTNRTCFGICQTDCDHIRSAYSWPLDNGSRLYVAIDGDCPTTFMPQLASGINYMNPDDHVYVESGVAVDRTAIGAPTTIFTGAAFGNVSSQYKQALVKLTQCVPVMTSNPVRCQKSGKVTAVTQSELATRAGNVTVSDRIWDLSGANALTPLVRNLTIDSAMSNDMWTNNQYPHNIHDIERIGRVVMVFGAWNDPQGLVPFASYLAGTISDPDESAGRGGNETYAVTCVVNPRRSFKYRWVTLDLRALGKGKESNYAQYLSGGKSCTPLNPTISNKMFAIAGTASYSLVLENANRDGYIGTLTRFAGFHRGPPYAFPESRNALEDVLGLVSGLAVSVMPLTDGGVSAAAVSHDRGADGNSSAVIEITRLGTSSSEALWLLIPPIGSLIILCILFAMGIRHKWVRGGRWFSGADDRRPKLYAAESVYQLIALGMFAARKTDYKNLAVEGSGSGSDSNSKSVCVLVAQTGSSLHSDSRACVNTP
ncbi:hypothetical protein F5Y19DRAFT_491367 [Xylariaceae sp. FL1651]|nr:hypothetical protein F5Y19DRAFT_491367 [Xylariaceae sp. FL1651]